MRILSNEDYVRVKTTLWKFLSIGEFGTNKTILGSSCKLKDVVNNIISFHHYSKRKGSSCKLKNVVIKIISLDQYSKRGQDVMGSSEFSFIKIGSLDFRCLIAKLD